jgi:hypothetical protein
MEMVTENKFDHYEKMYEDLRDYYIQVIETYFKKFTKRTHALDKIGRNGDAYKNMKIKSLDTLRKLYLDVVASGVLSENEY